MPLLLSRPPLFRAQASQHESSLIALFNLRLALFLSHFLVVGVFLVTVYAVLLTRPVSQLITRPMRSLIFLWESARKKPGVDGGEGSAPARLAQQGNTKLWRLPLGVGGAGVLPKVHAARILTPVTRVVGSFQFPWRRLFEDQNCRPSV